MANFSHDLHEHILVRLGVKDLSRFKIVCKTWYRLISSPRFVKSHLNHTYKIGHRRIGMTAFKIDVDDFQSMFVDHECHFVGSSNGLVCISRRETEVLVVNPLTGEARILQTPKIPVYLSHRVSSMYWGFGYDSSADDYKLVLGLKNAENGTYFQTLSLKSNVWKSIGQLKYSIISSQIEVGSTYGGIRIGTLCNGALHWFMNDENGRIVILAFDLSKDEFKEVPQPDDDARYECTIDSELNLNLKLGVFEDCLCIYHRSRSKSDKWVMKNYKSWALLQYGLNRGDDVVVNDVPDFFIDVPNMYSVGAIHIWFSRHIRAGSRSFVPGIVSTLGNIYIWLHAVLYQLDALVYVETLVSPHVNVNGRLKDND